MRKGDEIAGEQCDGSSQEGCQKRGGNILELLFDRIVDQFCREVAVGQIGQQGCAYLADQNRRDAERDADEHHTGNEYFLNDFQIKEEVGAPFHLQDVEVDHMQRIEEPRNA